MLKFIDEKGVEHLTQAEFSTQNGVNGERSISGTIYSGASAIHAIGRGWRLEHEDELYQITYAKPLDDGQDVIVEFDAIHVFFYDFEKSVVYGTLNGSHLFEVYLNFIFKDSGYTYKNEISVNAFEKENFGMKDRLTLFRDIINSIGAEFTVSGKIVRIVKKVGTDLSTIVKKGFNMQELTLEHDIAGFITYKKGFGAYADEEHKEKGRLTVEYESPLAKVYGRLEGNPVVDERYKQEDSLLTRIRNEVENSYAVSVQVDMEDLVSAGYKYERPHAGDYIMAINDELSFKERIRIVSFETLYAVDGEIIDHKVTCNSLSLSSSQSKGDYNWQSKVEAGLENAINNANHALVSADGKNMVFFGEAEPTATKKGDLWYKPVGEETILYMWDGEVWVEIISTKDNKIIENKLNELSEQAEQAEKDIEESINKANQAIEQSTLSNQRADEAKRNADAAIDKANEAKQESFNSDIIARDAKEQAIKAQQLGEGNRTEITKTNEKVQLTSSKVENQQVEITNIRADNEGIKSSVSSIKNDVDGISIGSTNMLTTTKDFSGSEWNNKGAWKEFESRLGCSVWGRGGAWSGLYQMTKVEKGDVLIFSLDIKTEGDADARLYWLNVGVKSAVGTVNWNGVIGKRENWSRVTSILTVSESGYVGCRIENAKANSWVYVSRMKLERGNKATDWSPAPSDNVDKLEFTTFEQNAKGFQASAQSDILGLKSEQVQLSGMVQSTVEKTNTLSQSVDYRNLYLGSDIELKGEKLVGITSINKQGGGVSIDVPGGLQFYRNKKLTFSFDAEIVNGRKGANNYGRLIFELNIRYRNGQISYHGLSLYIKSDGIDNSNFKGRHFGTISIRDEEITEITAGAIYIQCDGDFVSISNPKITLGDNTSGNQHTLAPEDVAAKTQITQLDSLIQLQAQKVTNNETEIGKLRLESNRFEIEIKKTNGQVSNLNQTFEGFRQTVQNDITGIKSEQVQLANQFTQTISSLNVANQNLILDSDKAQITSMNDSVLNSRADQTVSEWGTTDAFRVWGRTVNKELFGIIWTGHPGGKLLQRNTDYTHSIWIKNNTSNPLRVGNNMGNSVTIEGKAQRRIHMSVKSASDKDMGMALTFYSESTGFDFYYWHPMIAEGNVLSGYSSSSNEGVTQTQFTQTINDINMRVVEKGKVMSQINIDANRQLFDVQGNKVMITPETTYIENATIKSAMIDTINASKVTAGTFNGANMNVININVNSLVGNTTQFVRSAWNGINDSVQITGEGLIAYRNDGSVASKYLSDGIQIWSGGQWAGSLSDANGALVLWAKRGKRLDFGYQGNNSEGHLYYQALSINGNSGDIKFNGLVRPSGNAYTGMHFTTVEYEGYKYPSVLSESMKSGIMLGPSALYFLHNGYVYPFSQVLN